MPTTYFADQLEIVDEHIADLQQRIISAQSREGVETADMEQALVLLQEAREVFRRGVALVERAGRVG